ncbi:uncharacterized protein LOC125833324 [Solanum verrucosum]|uniref:uncharacterized protein LOC125833324 n=1 Tax=Solanum verrucosum TaxID=315347 RepID=UPI0020D142D6|nr:uncharacterized protein LOC125833324 [Solanum verrucosum]
MSGYAMFLKELATKKRSMDFETIEVSHSCSVTISSNVIVKKDDPGEFTTPCTIWIFQFAKALCELGASINLMPYAIFKQLGLDETKPTSMCLLMAERSIKLHVGILYYILVKATGKALVDVECGELKFCVNGEEFTFNVCKSMKQPNDLHVISVIDVIDEAVASMSEFRVIQDYDKLVVGLSDLGSYSNSPLKLDMDLKNIESPPAKPSIVERPKLELSVLKRFIKVIGWTIADIVGISPGICTHKIQLASDFKPSIEHQRRLNPPMQEVIKKEILKWIDAGVVYHITDSKWEKAYKLIKLKLKLLPNWPLLSWLKVLRCFLGHAGYYRRFIKDFSKVDHPLCNLLEKESVFEFDESCVKAFLCLKENLVLAPIIGALDWIVPFELICDASSVVLGVVFGQRKGNLFHTVYYARKTLNVAQRDYTVTEQELLAVVYAFEKFRAYLLGTVVVHTNHSVICYLMAKKNAIPRLIRWVLLLKEFDFEVLNVNV